jgi:O-antigen/teichoic acid export membrane protein
MKSISFYKGIAWLIGLNLLIKPVWIFFIDREVQNRVGYEEYGNYFALLNLSFVLLFLADAGLTSMINMQVAGTQPVNLRQILRIKFILVVLYIVSCCFVGWLTHIRQWELLLYLVLVQLLNSLFVFLRGLITAHQFFTADAFYSVIDKLLMVIVCGGIIYTSVFSNINIILFLQVQACCAGLAVILAFFFLLKKQLISKGRKETVDQIVKKTMPFAILILLMAAHYRLDGFLLQRISPNGDLEAGIYAAAYRLLDAGNMAGYLVASFLVPFIARNKADKKTVIEIVLNIRHGLIALSIMVVSFAAVFSPWIQKLLYHFDQTYNAHVIQLCLFTLPAYFMVHIYGSVLTATSRFSAFTRILIVSVSINLLLNLLLVPLHGALGCCIAALASQYFCAIACFLVASKDYQLPLQLKSVFAYVAFALLLTGYFYLAKMSISNVWVILAIALGFILLFLAAKPSLLKKYFFSVR